MEQLVRPPRMQAPPRYMLCPYCGNDTFRLPAPSNVPTCTQCLTQVERADRGETLEDLPPGLVP